MFFVQQISPSQHIIDTLSDTR